MLCHFFPGNPLQRILPTPPPNPDPDSYTYPSFHFPFCFPLRIFTNFSSLSGQPVLPCFSHLDFLSPVPWALFGCSCTEPAALTLLDLQTAWFAPTVAYSGFFFFLLLRLLPSIGRMATFFSHYYRSQSNFFPLLPRHLGYFFFFMWKDMSPVFSTSQLAAGPTS